MSGRGCGAVIAAGMLFLTGCRGMATAEGDAPGTEISDIVPAEMTAGASGQENSGFPAETERRTPEDIPGTERADDGLRETGGETLRFVDVHGQEYEARILPDAARHPYRKDAFVRSGNRLTYTGDGRFPCRYGVDVSYHQGEIDWQAVKADGIDFAFLRIGYRGYGEGTLNTDAQFFRNIEGAQAAGLDVGVYFFSQAVSREEARGEAEFVLDNLAGYALQLPVVYDPEQIEGVRTRADDLTGSQITENTICFCERIREAGYEAMVYSNMLWEAFVFDMARLSEYPFWYADYEEQPQTPYRFEFWQYSNEGSIAGIDGPVDLNVWMVPADGYGAADGG